MSARPIVGSMTPTATTSEIKDSILDTVGETPLVRLSRIGHGCAPQIVAKVEYFNPGGSIKDRVAMRMVEAAERDGRLRPGGTIIEPTSGNTGTGLAIAARLKGYRVIAVMPDKMSREKIDLLRAYGAEVVVTPTDVSPDSPQAYYRVADRLTKEIPGAFQPNQYANPANPETHYLTTGPELWRQSGGKITHFVCGVGTGGTISGVAQVPQGAEPEDRGHRRRPGRLDLLQRGSPSLPRRGRGRGLLAGDLRPVAGRPLRHRLRSRLVPDDAAPGRDRGPAGRRLVRARRCTRRSRSRRGSATPTRWSP